MLPAMGENLVIINMNTETPSSVNSNDNNNQNIESCRISINEDVESTSSNQHQPFESDDYTIAQNIGENVVIINVNPEIIPFENSEDDLDDTIDPDVTIDQHKPYIDGDPKSFTSNKTQLTHRLDSNSSTIIQNNESSLVIVEAPETNVPPLNTERPKLNISVSQCYDNVIRYDNSDLNRLKIHRDESNEPTPLLRNFSRQVSYRYPPFLSRDEGMCERTLHKSHSLPDLMVPAVRFKKNCRCDCHGYLNRQCSNRSGLRPGCPDFVLDVNKFGPAASYIPSGPSRQLSVIANMSTASSPTSSQAPPHYRSLIFSILQDEPPKYQDVTGKALSMELLQTQRSTTWSQGRPPTLMSCVTGFAIFIGVIIITSMVFYIIDSHFHVFKTVQGAHHGRGKLVPPPYRDIRQNMQL